MNSFSTVLKRATVGALILATMAPSMASAASPQELRRDRQEIREETRDLRAAKAYGDRRDVRDAREDLREARQEYREDRRDARRHPAFRADFRYRTFNTGNAISRSYYGPRYTVTNYRAMRLAAPGRHQVYVRHYGDLLLVNTRNGRVVKVVRGYYR